ncbi:hypothetical protein [Aquimarina litoralis]|uniref:hypothetical protein n=1 Tax=Aquimarina litoralis TaxID=584605 RepID=UPI001C58E249|nr:hypothetical protein [Aquimarina litoralis]MBW1299061.1 hypothetical protein [Aquimarina litoralis]
MENKLNKFLDPNTPKKELDVVFGEILKKKLDEDLRAQWAVKLSQEYGITRSKTNGKGKFFSSGYLKIFLAAAACISIIISLQLLDKTNTDSQILAQQYLSQQEILHPGTSKGASDENQTRILAILTFNNKDYAQSIQYFQNMKTQKEEDTYYHGLALLLDKKYIEAIEKFRMVRAISDRYGQELNWYQSIAYILDEQNDNALTQLKRINSTDWNYKNAQQLLKELNEE